MACSASWGRFEVSLGFALGIGIGIVLGLGLGLGLVGHIGCQELHDFPRDPHTLLQPYIGMMVAVSKQHRNDRRQYDH